MKRTPKPPDEYVVAKVDMTVTVFVELRDGMVLYSAIEAARKSLKWNALPLGPRICPGGQMINGRMMTQEGTRQVERKG